jgi:glucan phosphoethanolaminetransferase (alkaline phosphatase superfamily)
MPDPHEPSEPRSHPWIWVVYLLLFSVSVPWYLPAGAPPRLWFGLPHWVVLSLAAYLSIAVFTAYVVATYWSVPPTDDEPPDGESRP